ncbi:hypothetical protein HPB51_021740 [Rhipicephalus microplus]|uniref:Uncharacterized protein n=1 Tax=Rhipicephalus microplus TaxID=6941 RepID=A0A9J6DPL1_RHIMP|nr:hypothetical protein HPB51_021740 [Rhipicephalus microplus]
MEVSSKPQPFIAEETELLLNKIEMTAESEVSVEIVERKSAQEHQLDVISPTITERAQEEVGLPETEKKGDMPSPDAMDVADDVVDLLSNSDISLEEMRLLEYSSHITVESPAIIETASAETVESVAEDSELQEKIAIKVDSTTEEVAVPLAQAHLLHPMNVCAPKSVRWHHFVLTRTSLLNMKSLWNSLTLEAASK